ncbi:leucine-rich repeat-containing protein 25 [Thomomys bottae]
MGMPSAWLLLPPMLQGLASLCLACSVVSGDVDWTREFSDTCLNFSGQSVRLPQNEPLRARRVQVLDLSNNGLRELPPAFFRDLEGLQTLNVARNPLSHVAATLAARCSLDLQADCSCVLAVWLQTRRDNCSGPWSLQCVHEATGASQNLSTFLETSCPLGPTPATIGAAVAGSLIIFGIVMAGSLLAWRLRSQRGVIGQGKGWGAQDAARAGVRARPGSQPRYSSRGPRATGQGAAPPPSSTPDYENMVIGPAAKEPQGFPHRALASEDGNFYMNYDGPSMDLQAVYCNLESLGQAPQDEEEYMAHGC